MVKAKYDKANNINKMKENIVEMVLLELKPEQPPSSVHLLIHFHLFPLNLIIS